MRPTAIRQHAFVVADIERALDFWSSELGVGPFYYLPRMTTEFTFRGEPGKIELSIGLAQSGSVQIELLQQHNEAPSLLTEFTAAGGTGFHHIAYWTRDFDRDLTRFEEQGRNPVQTANPGGGRNRNCFFTTGDPAVPAIELSEISGPKGALFEEIAQAAREWDGRDPVRLLNRMRPSGDQRAQA